MTYYVMNAAINKDLGEYEREEDALTVVRALVERFGERHADDLVLATDQADGIAWTGEELVQRLKDIDLEDESAVASGRVQQER